MYVSLYEFQEEWTDKIKDVHEMNLDQKATKQQQQITLAQKKYIQKFVLQVHYLGKLKMSTNTALARTNIHICRDNQVL